MNIAFCLSKPIDFFPLYPDPIPPELFGFKDNDKPECLFTKIFPKYYDYFPNANYYAIDRSNPPIFAKFVEDLDVLNLPTQNLFAVTILFASFVIAFDLPPMCILLPSNAIISPFETFARAIKTLNDTSFISTPFLSICCETQTASHSSTSLTTRFYLKQGEILAKENDLTLYSIKKIIPQNLYNDKLREDRTVFGFQNIFAFDAMKLSEYLSSENSRMNDLFFLLVDAWKDNKTLNTLLSEIISELEKNSMESFVSSLNEKEIVTLPLDITTVNSHSSLLKILPVDENNNYIEGNISAQDTYDSILINKTPAEISVRNLSSTCIITNDRKQHIFKI
jgi:mannose-1-phosphate guanylyltransferase